MFRESSPVEKQTPEARPSGKSLAVFYKLLPYLKRYPRSLGYAGLSILTASLTVLALGSALRLFIDNGFSPHSSIPIGLTGTLILFLLVIIMMAFASYGRLYWVSQLSERIIADLRHAIFTHLLKQDIPFFETIPVSEIQSRLTTDTTLLQIVLGTSIPIGLRNLLIILGGIIMLIATSTSLTLLIAFLAPLVLIPILVYGRKIQTYSRTAQKKTAEVAIQLHETFDAIRTVVAFCRESFMIRLFSKSVEQAYQVSLCRSEARARLTAGVMILIFGAISVVLWCGGQDVISGALTAGDLSAFLFYSLAVAGAAGSLSEIHGDILRAVGAVERMFELLALRSKRHNIKAGRDLPSPLKGTLRFVDVTFAYPSRPQQLILNKTNFEVSKGEIVALVGPSGIGKTTLFNLLLRFYSPLSGEILLDDIPIDSFNVQALREAIGLVPQEPVLFSTTILENIRFGKLSATDEEVKAAAVAAYADEFIQLLPEGYNTQISGKGITFSGGQRQRIAIARAILRNPPLLLLDEATSALDTESEQNVQQALSELKHNRTTLIIAHRESTLKHADRRVQISFKRSKS